MLGYECKCLDINGFMVLWFYGFMVYGFMVLWLYGLWLYGFLVSWCQEVYQISMSCFQEDIDLISMILEILFNGISSFPDARLFQYRSKTKFPNLKNTI